MKPSVGTVFAALLLVPGCVEIRAPYYPEDPMQEWRDVGQAPLLAHSYGCGFCSGSTDAPEHWLLVLDDAGGFLIILHGRGVQEGVEIVGADDRPYRRIVEAAFAIPDAYGAGAEVRVHDVEAARLSDADRRGVEKVVERERQHLGPPSGSIDATDCGPARMHLRDGEAWRSSEAGCGIEAGKGWDTLRAQMRVLFDRAGGRRGA